jgi:hypoxanthine phosphoribosyltransferase
MTEIQEAEMDNFEILIPKETIQERLLQLAEEIDKDYENDPETELVLCGVLKGGVTFLADLSREIKHPKVRIDYMGVSSYGYETESSREPKITKDTDIPLFGKNVIIVEDIIDTGYSMATLLEIISARKPKSLKVCSLLSKPDRREINVPIDYLGFSIDDLWVEGYGLDTKERGRNKKDIFYKKQ